MSGTELDVPQTMHFEDRQADQPADIDESRYRSPRDEMMAAIVARREEQRQAEEEKLEAEIEGAIGAPVEAQEAPQQPAPEPQSAQEPSEVSAGEQPSAPVPVPAAAPSLRTVTLPNGQQFQVTDEQLVHLAAQGAIANLAIQQHQAQQQTPQPVSAPSPQPQSGGPLIDREKARAVVQRLAYGSPEDGEAALQDFAQEVVSRQPAVNPEVIRQQAVADALQHIQLQNDLARIGHEFPNIWNSRALSVGAAAELNDIRQRDALLGANRPAIEQYREACQRVMGQLPPLASQSAGDQVSPAVQAAPKVAETPRLERKRAAPRNPVAVSRSAGLGDEPSRPPSGSQIVAQMRQQRHQAPMH